MDGRSLLIPNWKTLELQQLSKQKSNHGDILQNRERFKKFPRFFARGPCCYDNQDELKCSVRHHLPFLTSRCRQSSVTGLELLMGARLHLAQNCCYTHTELKHYR
ncbi:Hypothetical predicted protein [Xyrichtys novacula]|uniref:Uncharacterized protein n=1 Tax=Xyrichtys novacula TaxID=13765 RepID=A0AAV1GHV3_XYRNO|nr:Hypothetical predicted protein [Xyrichtys novacula]